MKIFSVLIPSLLALMMYCASSLKKTKPIFNSQQGQYKVVEIVIDSVCIESIKDILENNYNFVPNYYECFQTNLNDRVIYFSKIAKVKAEKKSEENNYRIWSDNGVMVVLNDSCDIDSMEWAIPRDNKF